MKPGSEAERHDSAGCARPKGIRVYRCVHASVGKAMVGLWPARGWANLQSIKSGSAGAKAHVVMEASRRIPGRRVWQVR